MNQLVPNKGLGSSVNQSQQQLVMMALTKPKFVTYFINPDPRAENGKPITLPRNLYTNPTKKGQLSYFEPIKSLATSEVKDVFVEEGKRLLKEENESYGIGRK